MLKLKYFLSFNFLKPFIEIIFLWFVIYQILNFIRNTRIIQAVKAIVIILSIFVITQRLGLEVINWMINKIFAISVIALLIIFQPELRNGLIRLGGGHLLDIFPHGEKKWDNLIQGILRISDKKYGGLIALQKEVNLDQYIETGTKLDSAITPELIETIFYPGNPLHDGGIIIRGERIVSAGCTFPLSNNPYLSKTMGMRHRAAVGLSEESDALVIVVSGENGSISIAQRGILRLDVDEKILREALRQFSQTKFAKKI